MKMMSLKQLIYLRVNSQGEESKIKPFGFKENVLLAKVFNIKGTKEMTNY